MMRNVGTAVMRHRAATAASGCTAVAGSTYMMQASDQQQQRQRGHLTFMSDSNALPVLATSASSNTSSLIIPTLQATRRAINLVGAVMAIVYDYEYAKVQRSMISANPFDGKILLPPGLLGPRTDQQALVLELERQVETCRHALERAQAEYTGRGDEKAAERQISQDDLRRAVRTAAQHLAEAEQQLSQQGGDMAGQTHRKAAQRLVNLCRENAGVYIKIGQHLANLDYLIPQQYVETLSSLFDDAPETSISDVRQVIYEDLGSYPEDLFDDFDPKPIASASLAQVHVAYEKGTGRKLAIKVQHRGLRETSRGDILALQTMVRALEYLFPDEFCYGWVMEEIAPQLPKELDFHNEGKNSERAAQDIREAGINCIVPAVHWEVTSGRLLVMDYEEGFRSTDIESIEREGMKKEDVAKLISSVFNAQAFCSGFVHCDPHEANVLLRKGADGKPQIVLVDHGLYKQIDDEFRLSYARLWRALMMADIPQIKDACASLGIGKMYPLLAAMLTSRPFDEIVERSRTGALEAGRGGGSGSVAGSSGDKEMIRGYAQKFIVDILQLLDAVPRQMLLLFKMNDCLRHIDYSLGSPSNTLVTAGTFAAKAVYAAERQQANDTSRMKWIRNWMSYKKLMLRISAYEWLCWIRRRRGA